MAESSAACRRGITRSREIAIGQQAMKKILVPTESGSDWKRPLAKPELHWKPGKSAMSAAASWEASGDRFPSELSASLDASGDPDVANLTLIGGEVLREFVDGSAEVISVLPGDEVLVRLRHAPNASQCCAD